MNPVKFWKLLVLLMALLVAAHFVSCGGGSGGGSVPDDRAPDDPSLPPEFVELGAFSVARDPGLVAAADGTLTDTDIVVNTADGEGSARGYAIVTIWAGTRAFIGNAPAQGPLTTVIVFHDGDSEGAFPGAISDDAGDAATAKYAIEPSAPSAPITSTVVVPFFSDASDIPVRPVYVNGVETVAKIYALVSITMADVDGAEIDNLDVSMQVKIYPELPLQARVIDQASSPPDDDLATLPYQEIEMPAGSDVYRTYNNQLFGLEYHDSDHGALYVLKDSTPAEPVTTTVVAVTPVFIPESRTITQTMLGSVIDGPCGFSPYRARVCRFAETWICDPQNGEISYDGRSFASYSDTPGEIAALVYVGAPIPAWADAPTPATLTMTSTVEQAAICTCYTAHRFVVIPQDYHYGAWSDCGATNACISIMSHLGWPDDEPLTTGQLLQVSAYGSGCAMEVQCEVPPGSSSSSDSWGRAR